MATILSREIQTELTRPTRIAKDTLRRLANGRPAREPVSENPVDQLVWGLALIRTLLESLRRGADTSWEPNAAFRATRGSLSARYSTRQDSSIDYITYRLVADVSALLRVAVPKRQDDFINMLIGFATFNNNLTSILVNFLSMEYDTSPSLRGRRLSVEELQESITGEDAELPTEIKEKFPITTVHEIEHGHPDQWIAIWVTQLDAEYHGVQARFVDSAGRDEDEALRERIRPIEDTAGERCTVYYTGKYTWTDDEFYQPIIKGQL